MWLSLTPGNSLPRVNIPGLDKAVHFTFYTVLTLLMFYGWKKQEVFPALHRRLLVRILVCAIAYGLLIEVMQETLTDSRHFEVLDVLANSLGAIAGSLISVKLF